MKFVVNPANKYVSGYCITCSEECMNDCTKQCLSKN